MKSDAIIAGVMPHAGMWIVHHVRQRAYGPIVCVRASGNVVRRGKLKRRIEHAYERLHATGYSYASTVPDGYVINPIGPS